MYSHVFNLILEFVSITSLFKKKKKKKGIQMHSLWTNNAVFSGHNRKKRGEGLCWWTNRV